MMEEEEGDDIEEEARGRSGFVERATTFDDAMPSL
jgi:hypothetical protein